eukprot:CAMPEP_0181233036 /NCGR_PEP_ID=MMETSP1096-20121128/36103_1 /TAXON_ID=156174 ORGANISM="Chrysochromulina ericina, Strain CCMP281" /NCGR_SAMPLE_ID=MMETSP1096 /ASSEMBLY_ACC=CAM_ASM_000453 /LENGTH=45 /DNA_ID= /DNA_START= /DNA_END= /DNA_ORIENTATION=
MVLRPMRVDVKGYACAAAKALNTHNTHPLVGREDLERRFRACRLM